MIIGLFWSSRCLHVQQIVGRVIRGVSEVSSTVQKRNLPSKAEVTWTRALYTILTTCWGKCYMKMIVRTKDGGFYQYLGYLGFSAAGQRVRMYISMKRSTWSKGKWFLLWNTKLCRVIDKNPRFLYATALYRHGCHLATTPSITQKDTHTHSHAHARTHIHTCTHAHKHARTYSRAHTCACTKTHSRTHPNTHARTRTRTQAQTSTHASTHAHTYKVF